jgi:predicted amidophosphoribosyltransferase
MNCYNCGENNSDDKSYCTRCNAPLVSKHKNKDLKKDKDFSASGPVHSGLSEKGISEKGMSELKESSPWFFINSLLFFILLALLSDYKDIINPGVLNVLKAASTVIAVFFLYKWIAAKKILISESIKSFNDDDFDDM